MSKNELITAPDRRVLVALQRPPGYEDVHADLVAADAMHDNWPWEILRDDGSAVVVALDRPEGYERAAKTEIAGEAIKHTWPTWKILKAGHPAAR